MRGIEEGGNLRRRWHQGSRTGNRCSDYEWKRAKCHLKWKSCAASAKEKRWYGIIFLIVETESVKLTDKVQNHTATSSKAAEYEERNSIENAVAVHLSDWTIIIKNICLSYSQMKIKRNHIDWPHEINSHRYFTFNWLLPKVVIDQKLLFSNKVYG